MAATDYCYNRIDTSVHVDLEFLEGGADMGFDDFVVEEWKSVPPSVQGSRIHAVNKNFNSNQCSATTGLYSAMVSSHSVE
eukprot:CAMPEP_0116865146 /NCGR_PEP_ID=MMETSP0418-20121206/25233_1 /TAXON_ID=1158023 /ORGANISM="Astrosyne radiata, Strain 13vi08-1A" /LENGTH=79 /DNA_ID=CAMNT_0004500481 /DNA_START=198 /DNA_END=437 /DNA_ORIENTATION=+